MTEPQIKALGYINRSCVREISVDSLIKEMNAEQTVRFAELIKDIYTN